MKKDGAKSIAMHAGDFIAAFIIIFILFLFCGSLLPGCWSIHRIEHNAKKVITGAELQSWATNLLANYHEGMELRASKMGTNFPPQLLKLGKSAPSISVVEDWPNRPGFVLLTWVGPGLGGTTHRGFHIGSTNFTDSRRGSHMWQPGVYFWGD